MSYHDIFAPRTDRERAGDYLHRRRPLRPQAPPQEQDGLFAEPQRGRKRFVPLPEPTELFAEPQPQTWRLVPVKGWPDYCVGGVA